MFQAVKDFMAPVRAPHAPTTDAFLIERIIAGTDAPTPITVGIVSGGRQAIRVGGESCVRTLISCSAPSANELAYEFEGGTILQFRACTEAPTGICYRLHGSGSFQSLHVPWKSIDLGSADLDRITDCLRGAEEK